MENYEAIFKCRPALSDFKNNNSWLWFACLVTVANFVSHYRTTATILEHATVLLIALVLWKSKQRAGNHSTNKYMYFHLHSYWLWDYFVVRLLERVFMAKYLPAHQGINSVSIHTIYQLDLPSHHSQIYPPLALGLLALFFAGSPSAI